MFKDGKIRQMPNIVYVIFSSIHVIHNYARSINNLNAKVKG